MIGPFDNTNYLQNKLSHTANQTALQQIQKKYGISIDTSALEMISDGLHISGDVNLLWSYPSLTPSDFLKNRKDANYTFVGNFNERRTQKPRMEHRMFGNHIIAKKEQNDLPTIYFSLGTVVMGNLWNQQEQTRKDLKSFISGLADLWAGQDYKVIFASLIPKVLDSYPDNWEVHQTVDQIDALSKADVFVTHAGNNSFHEAALQKVPMVAIPFFGDQILVAKQIENLGIGINLGKNTSIDTASPKDFLDDSLIQKVDKAVLDILCNCKYRKGYERLEMNKTDIKFLLEEI